MGERGLIQRLRVESIPGVDEPDGSPLAGAGGQDGIEDREASGAVRGGADLRECPLPETASQRLVEGRDPPPLAELVELRFVDLALSELLGEIVQGVLRLGEILVVDGVAGGLGRLGFLELVAEAREI